MRTIRLVILAMAASAIGEQFAFAGPPSRDAGSPTTGIAAADRAKGMNLALLPLRVVDKRPSFDVVADRTSRAILLAGGGS